MERGKATASVPESPGLEPQARIDLWTPGKHAFLMPQAWRICYNTDNYRPAWRKMHRPTSSSWWFLLTPPCREGGGEGEAEITTTYPFTEQGLGASNGV